MVEEGLIAIAERDHYGRTQKVTLALREARLQRFTSDEIAVVTDVLDAFKRKNAQAISSLSHRFSGWKLAGDQEEIPYETALVCIEKPKGRDIQLARKMAAELEEMKKQYLPSDAG